MSSHSEEARVRVYFCRNAANGEMPAGLLRMQGHTDVAVEVVPCGGRIDPRYLMKAMESGAEAVCIMTCAEKHCKRMEGNIRANRRVHAVRELIAEAGMDPESIQMFQPKDDDLQAVEAAVEDMVRFIKSRGQQLQRVAVA